MEKSCRKYAPKASFFLGGGGFIFKWGRVPHGGASVLKRGVSKKIIGWGGLPPHAPHYGKPCNEYPFLVILGFRGSFWVGQEVGGVSQNHVGLKTFP